MRQQKSEAKTRREAEEEFPWAMCIKKIPGGWMCFESYHDGLTWEEMQEKKQ